MPVEKKVILIIHFLTNSEDVEFYNMKTLLFLSIVSKCLSRFHSVEKYFKIVDIVLVPRDKKCKSPKLSDIR